MERFGPRNLPPNPFLPPQPRTVMSIESGENGGGGSNKKEKEITGRELPPDKWVTVNSVATKYGVARPTILRLVKDLQEAHPESIRSYTQPLTRQPAEYLDPSLVKSIEEKLAIDHAPEGWRSNKALSSELGVDQETVQRIANKYRVTNENFFHIYKGRTGRTTEHYHPELIEFITSDLRSRKKAPEGWLIKKRASMELGLGEKALQSILEPFQREHPEWFKEYLDSANRPTQHVSPELIAILKNKLSNREPVPPGWITTAALAERLGTTYSAIEKRVEQIQERNPELVKAFVGSRGATYDHLSPVLVAKLEREYAAKEMPPSDWINTTALSKELNIAHTSVKRMLEHYAGEGPGYKKDFYQSVGADTKITYYHPEVVRWVREAVANREKAPAGWMTSGLASRYIGRDTTTFNKLVNTYKKSHPQFFGQYWSERGQLNEYYAPELIELLSRMLEGRQKPPNDWMLATDLAERVGISTTTVLKILKKYRETHPELFGMFFSQKNQELEYLHPKIAELVNTYVGNHEKTPPMWRTRGSLLSELHVADLTLQADIEPFRKTNPEWLQIFRPKTGLPVEHLHPDLVTILRDRYKSRVEKIEDEVRQKESTRSLVKLLVESQDDSSVVGKHFRSLLKAFGSSRYLDVLYTFRPEFKGIPAEKVKGLMAEYLGDFLISRGGFDKGDVDAALEHLSDLSLQEGLYETVKDDCFQFFLKQRRADGTKDPALVLERYRTHVEKELGHLDHPLFREIVEKAIRYYVELYSKFEKPPQIIDSLEAKRDFPDLNQLINIREISDKKRMLIADEMGLGKSASVILAKEHLGIHCALTVVPSNVLETWKRYLSDKPEQGGYFNPGQGPRVLVVEKNEQLQNLSWEQYDYILISQERLQGTYPEQLKRIGYDMLIVDEAHKLKTPTGTRSSNLAELTNEAGEHGYLALLSGTPVPNKIEDIAVTLKLLYPEKFKDISSKQLVHSIIKGDLVDLRSLLLPKMQRKRLEDGVEMPPLEEHEYKVELSKLEQQIYEVLLEDDELVATEKMRVMRQFLLNPSLVDSTPGIEGAKILALRERLADAFKESSSVVVFVNDYVEGVLRGSDAISSQLDLPSDVRIETIHGGTPRQEREAIQRDLREGNQRILLLVSGQTADVGVDFSSASHVIFYNEPWTEYQKRQELGRVYRPGLKHALESETLIAEGTIEQGMHEYIRRKHSAIEKLLSGVPITELEQRLLERAEKEEIPDLSVNPELAKYYFSSWDKMMKIFGYVKELGEEQFEIFLKEHGSEYAAGYQELGNRSYQANANRLASTLIDQLVRESNQEPSKQRILDMASGPEMLRKHGPQEYQDGIVSLDLNPEHFKTAEGKFVAGSWLKMPFPDKSFDYLNLSLSLHYTNFVPKKGKLERLELLKEMNRVLEVGGKAILSLIYSYGLKNPEMLREAVKELGFEVAERWTGDASHGDSFQTHVITLNKMNDLDSTVTTEELSERLGRDKREGLKFAERKARLRDSRRILTGVQLNGEALPVQLNKADQEAYTEEQQALKQGEQLRDQYGSITKIPAEKIIELGFARIRSGEKYILFKKLEKSSGAILVR